jgi:quinol monooxygenase YgiN
VAPRERQQEILGVLRMLMAPLRADPACTGCRLYRSVEDDRVLAFEEEWRSKKDLERHMRSDDYRIVLSVLDCSTEPPEVNLQTIGDSRGMELMASFRGSGRQDRGSPAGGSNSG